MLCYGCMTEYNGGVCPHCGYSEGTEDDSILYLKPGTELAGRYIVGRALSLCEMGTDYIALDKAGNKRVLIKELLPLSFCTRAPGEKDITVFSGDKAVEFDKRLDWFIGRCRVLSELADIPELHTCTDLITENKTAYAVFELPCGETLGAYLKEHGAMPAEAAVKMLLPAMRALSVCHRHGLLHLSVSPEQFTVSPGGNITLTGFLFDHDLIFEDEPPLTYVFFTLLFCAGGRIPKKAHAECGCLFPRCGAVQNDDRGRTEPLFGAENQNEKTWQERCRYEKICTEHPPEIQKNNHESPLPGYSEQNAGC